MCGRKRNPSVFDLIMVFIVCVVALSVFLLIVIQIAFSIDAPVPWLHPVWDASGLLGYLGALVAQFRQSRCCISRCWLVGKTGIILM